MNVRAAAASVVYQVIDKGVSLSTALPEAQERIALRDHALLQTMCFGVIRFLPQLESIIQTLMDTPLKGKQRIFHHLLLVGLYQLKCMRIPDHAAVGETVNATRDLRGDKLKGLINAILRNYQRQKETLDESAISHQAGLYCHPSWLLKILQENYPNQWQNIVESNNTKAPMWLRVNEIHHQRDDYLHLLEQSKLEAIEHSEADNALKLSHPCDVKKLPGFDQGWVSVQDAAAQLAVDYLQAKPNELILDCCAAPGGKTAHILERCQQAKVVAVDCDEHRLKRVYDNLSRLQLKATVICGDASQPEDWWQGEQFDRILLDAPCSATGVIRRHPDIKWLRRKEDIDTLSELQRKMLNAMWQHLKPGGRLVYATCSILPQENKYQIQAFLTQHPNAQLLDSEAENPGRQILPGEEDMDGFYYAVLQKLSS